MKSSILSSLSVVMGFIVPNLVFAQAGSGAGNGGGGEPLFHSLTETTVEWVKKNLADGTLATKLRLGEAGISAEKLAADYTDAVREARVKFVPANKLEAECRAGDQLACKLKDTSRTCMNAVTSISAIVCNEDLFNARPGDEQFTVAFHEHLGLKGIETNDSEDFSRYPISKHLMAFANPRTVVRWELSATERVVEAPRKGCNLYIKGGNRGTQINGYTFAAKSKADFVIGIHYRGTRATPNGYMACFNLEIQHLASRFSRSIPLDEQEAYPRYFSQLSDLPEIIIHPENNKILEKIKHAASISEVNELKSLLRPELDLQRELWLVSLLPSCDQMYSK